MRGMTATALGRPQSPKSPRPDIPVLFLASVFVPFTMMAIGERLFYDSVIPEVAGLVLTGAVLAYRRPKFVPLWLLGIAIGISLSERVFPATPPAEHVLRYGQPKTVGVVDVMKISAFPFAGSVLGILARGLSRLAGA